MALTLIDLQIPQAHACYDAHFPGNPIVPGALLLQWIANRAHDVLGFQVSKVKSMKFITPVKPNDRCVLEFSLQKSVIDNEEMIIKVCCKRGAVVICKGTLLSSNKLTDKL